MSSVEKGYLQDKSVMTKHDKSGNRHISSQLSSTQRGIYCLLDANLNRVREGIRTVEDTARYILNEPTIYCKLRNLRHRIDRLTRKIYPKLVLARDTQIDPGRKLNEKQRRNNIKELVIANFRRSEEGIRVLEEYSRLISSSAGQQFKNIRYQLYTLEKKLLSNESLIGKKVKSFSVEPLYK